MTRALRKTFGRTARFLMDSLAWRGEERPYALVGWGLLAGLVWIAVCMFTSPSSNVAMLPGQLILLAILAAVCAIDSRFGIIPNSLIVALAVAGILQVVIASSVDDGAGIGWWITPQVDVSRVQFAALARRAIDMAVVFAAAESLRFSYRAVRGREGLGFGDVKFVAAAALWIGLEWMPFLLLAAVTSALCSIEILRREGNDLRGSYAIAFGPHLAIGAWLAVVASEGMTLQSGLP